MTFARGLVLWQDLDGNGESSENEIIKVEDSGLKSISLNYNESNFIDAEGNAHKQQSTVEWQNGTTTKSADVWFATQLTHTIYTSSVIDQNILVLPNVIGFGNLLNLHDAAQTNVVLLDLVETIYQSSNNPNQEDIINLIYEWGNVSDLTIVSNAYLADKVNITSIDPRKLAIIETITGSNYSQNGSRNPGGNAAKILEAEFSSFVEYVYSTIVLEKKYPKLLSSLEIYIYDDGSYGIDFSGFEQFFKTLLTENKINDLNELINLFSKYVIFSPSISQAFKIYILELYLEYELFQIEGVQLSFLNTITDQDDFILGDQTNNIFKGGSGNDLILGMDGNDILYGDDGHDILIGGEGNDKLYGGAGNDILDGGAGNDTLDGGAGNDQYLFGYGDGQDTISAYDNRIDKLDQLVFKDNVTTHQVTFTRIGTALQVNLVDSTDSIKINNFFNNDGIRHDYAVQEFIFADGSLLTAEQVALSVQQSTNGDDTLYGYINADHLLGGEGNDTLYGYNGDDLLEGQEGNDTLYGGNGNDQLLGGAGNDILYGDDGHDILIGGEGNDKLYGGAGNDILDGGAGNDTLDGGAGNDIFIYNILSNIDSLYGNGEDSINNFKLGEDLIDLTALFVEYKDREDFDLNDFIRVESTITSNRSTIYLDRDGKNNDYTSTKFIELNSNMKNLSVEDLFNNVIII